MNDSRDEFLDAVRRARPAIDKAAKMAARRAWLRPGALVGIGTDGPVVEAMSFEDSSGTVFARMIPGDATSARYVPAAGLQRLTPERHQAYVEELAEQVEFGPPDLY